MTPDEHSTMEKNQSRLDQIDRDVLRKIQGDVSGIFRDIHGSDDNPGLMGRMTTMEDVVFGRFKEDKMGLVTKVAFMWKIHTALYCGMAFLSGLVVEYAIQKWFH